jgi:hypothetical protein
MKACFSECQNEVTVELSVEISSEPLRLISQPSSNLSQTDKIDAELLDRAMSRVHTQLLPLLRKARLLIEASLAKEVFDSRAID